MGFNLSTEQKRRIEQEERVRSAEDQYRAEVRERIASGEPDSRPRSRTRKVLIVLALIFIFYALIKAHNG